MKCPPPPKSEQPTEALAFNQCLAKTRMAPDGSLCAGRTVEEHCRIVGAVAQALLAQAPPCLRALFPEGSDLPARVHDIGKVCPTFQAKIYRAAGLPVADEPALRHCDPTLEKQWGGHAAISYAELHAEDGAACIDSIVGQHHGFSPPCYPANGEIFGGEAWHAQRQQVLRLLRPSNEAWPVISSVVQEKLLAGLTIVADWIGSGERFDVPATPWQPCVPKAIAAAGFCPVHIKQGLTFEEIFPFSPLAAQQRFYEAVTESGVYIFEAPMGMGKTEAALYAAYCMLASGKSSGIYFALPTQLTSNLIHTRLEAFLEKILVPGESHKALLLHGKAWLTRFLQQEMGEDAAPQGAWFHNSKRGILAPFAVGTVDQALMAAMHVRHSAVRLFGLAGKTVILDEVHSYDAYTGTLLDALVALLRQCGCTVLILSATLTAQRRAAFTGHAAPSKAYPLVSLCHTAFAEIPCPIPQAQHIVLVHSKPESAVEEALCRAEQGQQVLWIENTVAEAQAAYALFSARASGLEAVAVGLVHSRFSPADRAHNEVLWTGHFGKNSHTRQESGRILVGTQVLEQSLDIDADFLVSQFCPTDMLLQRLGRLWRHAATPRPSSARREAWLIHPPLPQALAAPRSAFGSSGHVYAPYVLCRSLELWAERQQVTLPTDIRPLVEATYAVREEKEPALAAALRDVEKERDALRSMAVRGIATQGSVLQEATAFTRIKQRPEVDVLLLRSLNRQTGMAVLCDGSEINLIRKPSTTWRQRQENAMRLSMNSVHVPEYIAPKACAESILRQWFAPWVHCFDAQTQENVLRVCLVLESTALCSLDGTMVSKYSYRKDYGYRAE
ncbi:MAG: CRISPR-associated helicase Cas3' [Desulfovibrionaceae bacterium]|nr:CRISPR-associated helicase Cas3' [Desulfovibrionaceae bacterium]